MILQDYIFQNYHRHGHYSNIMTPDSATSNEEYAKRACELGHTIIASGEHGWQGYYYETFELAKKYNLKFIFSVEAYWVKNRFEQDNTNSHIILIAKTEKGRRAINSILSEANITGYYYKPRIDLELLFQLPPDDVFITSACTAFWQYEDIDDIVVKLHKYFKDNFMLEVQYHDTDKQRDLNKKILTLSRMFGINIIMGCDSHYIFPEDSSERNNVLEAKGIYYQDEEGWYLDYPTGEEAFNRFKKQGILSDNEIITAMNNTNIILTFDDITFNRDVKLPTLYPNLTQKEKNKIFIQLIRKKWQETKHEIPKNLHELYQQEIVKEVEVICNTGMADYFLLDYYIVKDAIENGGIITPTGRGSGVSYYINKLLGFTKVDRISAQVKMYPERFISETRILQSKTLPDLDLNLGNPEVFAQSQTKLLGEGHSYPMIAFGTFKGRSAFKLYARAKGLDYSIANEVSGQLDKYETALKYADEDEKDLIDISEFVDSEYMPYIEESKKYQGIISDKKSHPCGYLIYSGDIKSEIGLIKCKTESTNKEVITVVIDGNIAENYKFLKNDLLKVDVVKNNEKVYERAGVKSLSVLELIKECEGNSKVWDIYKKGLTQCVNQVEKYSTTEKVKKYKPTNISELTAFVAGIRPSFKSMYHVFEARQPFTYNIKAFDNILQTTELPYSFVLYQEQMMATLQYAGFPADETYTIIKAIAKKHPEVVIPLKNKFKSGFGKRIKEEESYLNDEQVNKMCDDVWQIIEDASEYGFNASHAYCVACDSLNGAYLKANYPFEFYEVMLNAYTEKGNKEKVALLTTEMEIGFGIKLGKYKFRNDNREFRLDKDNNCIYPALKSIKFLNNQVAEELYMLRDNTYATFTDLLVDIKHNTSTTANQVQILIMLGYFEEFGSSKKLMQTHQLFDKRYDKKHTDKTKIKRIAEIKEFESTLTNAEFTPNEKIKAELEYLGYAVTIVPQLPYEYVMVVDVVKKWTHPLVTILHYQNGETEVIKIKNPVFQETPLEKFNTIKIINRKLENKWKPNPNGGWMMIDEKEWILKEYVMVK